MRESTATVGRIIEKRMPVNKERESLMNNNRSMLLVNLCPVDHAIYNKVIIRVQQKMCAISIHRTIYFNQLFPLEGKRYSQLVPARGRSGFLLSL